MNDSPWKYFSREELSCHCDTCNGSWYKMDDAFMRKLVSLREQLGFALPITSAYRCPQYNNKISSTGLFGPHTTGKAVDVGVRGIEAFKLIKAAQEMGFTGIGVNQKGNGRFIHLDILTDIEHFPRPNVWSY
jgi:zinc D-Ala-D-Ala carboxypeptidase